MENSKIEWTNHTANLWWGCSRVHDGCNNCYAAIMANRYGFNLWEKDSPRRMIASVWKDIEKYQRLAAESGEIHRVFIGSMMDIFEKSKPLIDHKFKTLIEGESEFWNTGQLRDKLFNEVIPNSPNLMFLLLTKRPSNINKYIPKSWKKNPPKNVMFGTSPVNQETAEKLISQLDEVNGYKFLSVEPQLEDIDFTIKMKNGKMLIESVDWIIQGGESGHGRRPFDVEWGRKLRDLCLEKGVPYFFKQIDKKLPIPEDLLVRQFAFELIKKVA